MILMEMHREKRVDSFKVKRNTILLDVGLLANSFKIRHYEKVKQKLNKQYLFTHS